VRNTRCFVLPLRMCRLVPFFPGDSHLWYSRDGSLLSRLRERFGFPSILSGLIPCSIPAPFLSPFPNRFARVLRRPFSFGPPPGDLRRRKNTNECTAPLPLSAIGALQMQSMAGFCFCLRVRLSSNTSLPLIPGVELHGFLRRTVSTALEACGAPILVPRSPLVTLQVPCLSRRIPSALRLYSCVTQRATPKSSDSLLIERSESRPP